MPMIVLIAVLAFLNPLVTSQSVPSTICQNPACSCQPSDRPTRITCTRCANDNQLQPEAGMFSGMPDLTHLYISQCIEEELVPGMFTGLSRLRGLRLDGNQFTTLSAGVLNDLPQLNELWLTGNHLRQIEAFSFAGLNQLRTLDLRSNSLNQFGPHVVNDLPQNVTVDFYNNPLVCECDLEQAWRRFHQFGYNNYLRCAGRNSLSGRLWMNLTSDMLQAVGQCTVVPTSATTLAPPEQTEIPLPGSPDNPPATSLPEPGSPGNPPATSLPGPGSSDNPPATSLPEPGSPGNQPATSLPVEQQPSNSWTPASSWKLFVVAVCVTLIWNQPIILVV